ncbi:PKc-like superfamily domain-containing protein [Histoplasma ohiense]|nr:PKc-like superfamily domain-containing protein [Histoplasma ohiense (nom. inval.)]
MNQEQLGFDPTIVTHGTKRYITIEKDGGVERLVIDEVIGRARCVAGWATTCWKVHREDEPQTPLVVKDSWQYPERDEEGKLLYEAAAQGVTHVARYYHHETVRVDGKDDDVLGIRSGLVIPTGQKKASSKATSSRSKSRQPCTDSSRVSGQKRSSDFVDTAFPPPPSKRALSSSPAKPPLPDEKLQNRVHCRVVVQDYGKPIFESSSRVALLVGLQGCIKGYMSLYQKTGLMQSDISPRNLLVNEDKDNPSFRAFLIDLDLAIRVNRDGFSGARGKTGTRPFMAIGVLFGERHSFMHDLESFFWVLFWICIHYEGPGRARTVKRFEKWNYMDTDDLADTKKGVITIERDFLRTTEDNFTTFYQPLTRSVNRLRRLVFPGGDRWQELNPGLPMAMIKELQRAQKEQDVVGEQ